MMQPDDDPESGIDPRDAQALMLKRLGAYQEIWEDAMAKMMTGSYRSEHLVEDWFKWWGHAARDMTAATTLAFGSATNLTNPPGSPVEPDEAND